MTKRRKKTTTRCGREPSTAQLSAYTLRVRTAFHEAGHAVLACLLRQPFHYASIEPDGPVRGHVMLVTSPRLPLTLYVALLATVQLGCSPSDTQINGDNPMTITVTSNAFDDEQPIPKKYTGDGEDRSPPLSWSGVPEGTKQLSLICDDPDAPRAEPWVHWVLYRLPADLTSLPEAVSPSERLDDPAGAYQGANSWSSGQTIGYRGPAPPPGKPHRYYFKLYALDTEVDLEPGSDKDALLRAMQGHILAEGQLMGTYQR